jgi:iron complex transport system ATP-binding protein
MPAPRLLLLDEPASGLDLAARELLLAALGQLASFQPDLATVVVSHHLEDLPAHTTHALLLAGGRVVAAGQVGAALTDAAVSACFGVGVEVRRHEGRWLATMTDRAACLAAPSHPMVG